MSDFAWIMLVVIVYFICRAIVQYRAGKTWDE